MEKKKSSPPFPTIASWLYLMDPRAYVTEVHEENTWFLTPIWRDKDVVALAEQQRIEERKLEKKGRGRTPYIIKISWMVFLKILKL